MKDIEMVNVRVYYSDGEYSYMLQPEATLNTVKVPKSTVEMWDAICHANRVMNTQLRQLDDEIWNKDT